MAVLAYEMTTGRRPFNAQASTEIYELQRQGVKVMPCDLRPRLNEDAQTVILKGLSFKPNNRYHDANEFGSVLEEALKPKRRRRFPTYKLVLIAAAIIAVAALSTFEIFRYRKSNPPKTTTTEGFIYWLMVQRYSANNKEPERSNGTEVFRNGDKIQINVSSQESSYIYVFNEGPPEQDHNNFTLMYPRANVNSGSATVGANQTLQTDWVTFKGPPSAENVWIIWSSTPVSELENAKNEAFKNDERALTGETLSAIKTFLKTTETETKPKVTKYKEPPRVTVRGADEMLVTFVSLNHH
jgi:serine/threonine protein kinase